MICTDDAAEMPILRPLVGMDKIEIIEKAKQIGTFETSILPFEDCCTVFTPRHPRTKPSLEEIVRAEQRCAALPELEKQAAEGARVCVKHFYDRL